MKSVKLQLTCVGAEEKDNVYCSDLTEAVVEFTFYDEFVNRGHRTELTVTVEQFETMMDEYQKMKQRL